MTDQRLATNMLKRLRPLILTLVCALLTSALSGCSSFKQNKRLDMGIFAEDMIAVAGEIQYSLGQSQSVYIRDYIDTPELVPLQIQTNRAKRLVRGVIYYSIQLVTVGDSQKQGHEQAIALAGYLERVLHGLDLGPGSTLDLTPADVDTIMADIRAQNDFLDAINAAQPVVDEVAIASGQIFDDTKTAMDSAVIAVRRRISERFHDVRKADELLGRRQMRSVFNIAYLAQIRQNIPGALDSLIVHEPSIRTLVNTSDGLDAAEIQRIEDRMMEVMTRIRVVRDQLQPDIEMYYRHQNELDELEQIWHAELRKARVSIVAWARGHKRMAAGIVDPAAIDILGIARKASGSVLPLP